MDSVEQGKLIQRFKERADDSDVLANYCMEVGQMPAYDLYAGKASAFREVVRVIEEGDY